IEILKANKNYELYTEAKIVTTKLNLFELYSAILREKGEDEAKKVLELYYPFVVDFNKQTIEESAKLKNKINKRDVSMTDCIGYTVAKQLGIKFLTGDSAFQDLENVEFVK
ncbi:MAG: PIN domain-containing protein, partial [Nanoarchaeota archaeon]|nr:PIN domain-containing protein [Nanoarchaeota archaeon]